MATHEDISVTTIDDFSPVAHVRKETRKLSEYRMTNMPLSESEIQRDKAIEDKHEGWAPRTLQNIHYMMPLPETTPSSQERSPRLSLH